MNPLYLLIPFFIIFLLLLPVIMEVRLTFNITSKSGVICVYLYGIKVFYNMYEIKGRTIILKNEKETKEKQLDISSPDLLLLEYFTLEIKDKTRLKELLVFYNLGCGDAFYSAMLGGVLNSFLLTFFASVKSKKPTASLGVYDTISYNKSLFEIALKGKMTITLVDVVYSFINSVILTWKAKSKAKHNI